MRGEKSYVGVSWPIRQSGRLDLEDVIYLCFKGLFCPCWRFNFLELLHKILLDSNSVQAIIEGYNTG